MSALIIRLPVEKRTRLKLVAKSRKVSVTKLFEEMATILLADFDAETRFELRAACGRGRVAEGLWTKRRGHERALSTSERGVGREGFSPPTPRLRFFGSHEEYDKIDAETV